MYIDICNFSLLNIQFFFTRMFQPPIYVISRSNTDNLEGDRFQTFGNKNEIRRRVKCRDNFNQYMSNTTLHGLRYVGDRNLSHIER